MSERSEIAQDLNAMRNARTRWAAEDIRRAMQGLGRWTDEAQRVYEDTIRKWGTP